MGMIRNAIVSALLVQAVHNAVTCAAPAPQRILPDNFQLTTHGALSLPPNCLELLSATGRQSFELVILCSNVDGSGVGIHTESVRKLKELFTMDTADIDSIRDNSLELSEQILYNMKFVPFEISTAQSTTNWNDNNYYTIYTPPFSSSSMGRLEQHYTASSHDMDNTSRRQRRKLGVLIGISFALCLVKSLIHEFSDGDEEDEDEDDEDICKGIDWPRTICIANKKMMEVAYNRSRENRLSETEIDALAALYSEERQRGIEVVPLSHSPPPKYSP